MTDKQNAAVDSSLPNFDAFVDEQVGFAPYWPPKPGAWFYGKVIDRDNEGEAVDFVRYTFVSAMPLHCQRGPAEDAEPVDITKGEHFTISVYHAIAPLLDAYLEMPEAERPFIQVISVAKRPTKTKGREVWNWRIRVAEEDKKRLEEYRLKGLIGAKSAAAE